MGCTWKNLLEKDITPSPRFNSINIESIKDQIWFRAKAAQIYERSSVESSSVSSRVKASP